MNSDALIGTWSLESWEVVDSTGAVDRPFGEKPIGYIMYSPEGYIFALCMGILNSQRHFFAPAFAPIFLNISIIISVFLFYHTFKIPVMTLALGVLAGGIIQFLFQIPFLRKKGITFRFDFYFRHPAIKRIGLLMVPGLIGTAVYQINVFIDTIFASFLASGRVSYLFYADRLMEFPLGTFAIAVGMASLQSLSAVAAQGKIDEFKETLSFTFRLTSFISIPAMVGATYGRNRVTPVCNVPHFRNTTSRERSHRAVRQACDNAEGRKLAVQVGLGRTRLLQQLLGITSISA